MSLDELRRALNQAHKVDVGDYLTAATGKWLSFLARQIDLCWLDGGHEHYAKHAGGEFTIRRLGETWALRAHFRTGGSRILAHGDVESLKERAESVLRIGGPFGGSCPELDEWADAASERRPGAQGLDPRLRARKPRKSPSRSLPREPPRRTRPAAMLSWSLSPHEKDVWAHPVGAGYEARIRPIRDKCALFVIGPHGTFCCDRFELFPNAVQYAAWFCRVFDDLEDDFSPEVQPFHVRVRGIPHRLIYTPIPGLAGHARTDVGDVFLCVPGDDLVALVVIPAEGEPACVASGRPRDLNGWEMRPSEVPQALPELDSSDAEALALAIDQLSHIAVPVRAHLVTLARSARKAAGMETVREFLRGVCVAHAKGHRENLRLGNGELFGWLHERGFVAAIPDERSERAAANWLAEHSPLFARVRHGRTCSRLIQFQWFSTPSEECLQEIARTDQSED